MGKKYGKITTIDYDFIYNANYGLIISNKHKEYFITHIEQEDVVFHKVVIVGEREDDEDQFFHGYWLMMTPERDLDWVDTTQCWYADHDIEDTYFGTNKPDEIYTLDTVYLKTKLKAIPLEKRQLFNIADDERTYFMNTIIHNSLVDYLKLNDKKEQLLFLSIKEVQEEGYVKND